MNPVDELWYFHRVDQLMKKLQAVCLGQNTPLSAVLPPALLRESQERQADFLARQLTFALALACDDEVSHGVYERSRAWLKDAILYLLRRCRSEDQNFYEVGKLIRLPLPVREILLADSAEMFVLARDETMPWPLENYDIAVVMLLASLRLDAPMKQFFRRAEALGNEGSFEV